MSKATDKARAALEADMARWRTESDQRSADRLATIRSALPLLHRLAPQFVRERRLDLVGDEELDDVKDAAVWTVLESTGIMIDTDELLAIVALAAERFEQPR